MSAVIRTIGEVFASTRKDRNAASMPLRVLEAISKNDELSEVLVKLIQILIFGTFGILYLVSPSSNTELSSQVPLVVSIYLVFSVIGLGFAIYRIMPAWAVYASIIVDIVLLTYLIWSFHIQYGQPASFYLKAPTMLYVFIFIALRALRFEPRYVFRTGLAAAAGWGILLLYALYGEGMDPPVTRDYVEYLSGFCAADTVAMVRIYE